MKDEKLSDILDLVRMRVTTLNRSLLISFGLGNTNEELLTRSNSTTSIINCNDSNSCWSQIPSSACTHCKSPHHSNKRAKTKDQQSKLSFSDLCCYVSLMGIF